MILLILLLIGSGAVGAYFVYRNNQDQENKINQLQDQVDEQNKTKQNEETSNTKQQSSKKKNHQQIIQLTVIQIIMKIPITQQKKQNKKKIHL